MIYKLIDYGFWALLNAIVGFSLHIAEPEANFPYLNIGIAFYFSIRFTFEINKIQNKLDKSKK